MYRMYGADIVAVSMIVGVGWSWVNWFRKQDRIRPPKWRSILAVTGFALATTSVAGDVVLTVIQHFRGGSLPFYDPTWLFFIGYGFVISVLGVLCGAIGKNYLRIPAILWSSFMVLNWFAQGISQ